MSRLFEALQRSEAEKTSAPFFEPPTAAAELLKTAEKGQNEFRQFETLPISPAPDGRLVCLTAKESLAAEKFRYLVVRLRQIQQTRALKRILITSTLAEEGKSVVSANLALALARRHWQKTLLIEGDLRRPVLAERFGLGRLPGLTEWLCDGTGPLPNIYQLEDAGLWILPAGKPAANPLELMHGGGLGALMDDLSEPFDWIVIDSPPILPLADTSIWNRHSDGVLLVVREGKSEKRQVKAGLESLGTSNLLGVVLNGSSNTDHRKYYQRYYLTGSQSGSSNGSAGSKSA
ncbi:MAG TPA: CpsD/CapB family tyrosine-protein kinase [Terriglobales bacterium]|nr:CpsD/CapB family tyrosine-protein kinase [Terriglobales bacterium]